MDGGAWESLVKVTNRALKAVIKERTVKEEVLVTVTAEVESIVNSKPITSLSDDIEDFEVITPSHLLLGRSSTNFSFLSRQCKRFKQQKNMEETETQRIRTTVRNIKISYI